MPVTAKKVLRPGKRLSAMKVAKVDYTAVKQKMKIKKESKNVATGMGSLASVNVELEMSFLDKTFREDPDLRQHVCSLLHNGLLQEGLKEAKRQHLQANSQVAAKCGKALVGGRGDRWRACGPQSCILLVQELLVDTVPDYAAWFQGEARMLGALAVKALQFCLGVTDGVPLPLDHQHAMFSGNLIPLVKSRYMACGSRLLGVCKDTLATMTDYFVMVYNDAGERQVVCNLQCHKPLVFKFSLNDVHDWVIEHASSYAEASLVSQLDGTEALLCRTYEKSNVAPLFDDEFTYGDFKALAVMSTPLRVVPPAAPIHVVQVGGSSASTAPMLGATLAGAPP
jgi:hypothetical protein